jgi:outer membrane immunogenic protein
MKKLIQLSATPALLAGMTALSPGAAQAQSLLDDMNFYIGATGGYLSGDADHKEKEEDGDVNTVGTDADLGILSLIAGIDTHTAGGWLFGIEGDIGLPVGSYPNDDFVSEEFQWTDMNYNAHLRGRVGARFGDADVFVAAGLAVAEFEQEVDENEDTHTLVGLSLGAGVDWFFTDRLRARIEILHDDYDREDTFFDSDAGSQYSGDWTDTTVRGGLLFQF